VTRTEPDRLVLAELTAAASRHASTGTVEGAIAELREIAGDRPDLLAQAAGVAQGYGESQLDAGRYVRMAGAADRSRS
jgi:hypothetical protein